MGQSVLRGKETLYVWKWGIDGKTVVGPQHPKGKPVNIPSTWTRRRRPSAEGPRAATQTNQETLAGDLGRVLSSC